MTYNFTEHEKRVNQEAEARWRRRMMTPLRSPSRIPVLYPGEDVTARAAAPPPGSMFAHSVAPTPAAADEHLFARPSELTATQKQQIAADLKKNEQLRAGEVEPPLPADMNAAVRSWIERLRRPQGAKEPEIAPRDATQHWPRQKSPFERFGC